MTDSGSYNLPASAGDVATEIERLAAQARLGWDKEARALSWFGLRDGMAVLELGSGPGFITRQLLELLPNSTITCLEIDPELVRQAEQHLTDNQRRRVQFVAGSVMDIQLEANQFDVAYARYLFQHLPDPIGAARQFLRVLKPGGKLIVHDIDDALSGLFDPPLPELPLIVEQFGRAQASHGGNRQIGRRLWRMLEDAGFGALDLDVIASHSGAVGVAPFLRQLDPDRLHSLVAAGLLSAETLEQFRRSQQRLATAPEPFALWLSLLVCGEKPL